MEHPPEVAYVLAVALARFPVGDPAESRRFGSAAPFVPDIPTSVKPFQLPGKGLCLPKILKMGEEAVFIGQVWAETAGEGCTIIDSMNSSNERGVLAGCHFARNKGGQPNLPGFSTCPRFNPAGWGSANCAEPKVL